MQFRPECKEIGPECPVEVSILGYSPNKAVNIFFLAAFAILLPHNVYFGAKGRTWGFLVVICVGLALETVGYASRLGLETNPFGFGFKLQSATVVIGPSFFTAGIYLTVKHIVLALGPAKSRVRPALYPWIFIPCDALCLALQAVGATLAATLESDKVGVAHHVILAGVVLQVITLSLFVGILVDFGLRLRRSNDFAFTFSGRLLFTERRFRFFCACVGIATTTTYVRCVYRIIEMQSGITSTVMRDEVLFIIFEGLMSLLTVAALSIAHPTYCFPRMGTSPEEREVNNTKRRTIIYVVP